jgi:dipeptidyl-peptidase-4
MRRFIFILFLLPIYFIGFCQEQLLTIEDAVIGQWRALYPSTYYNQLWRGNSSNFTFQDYQNIYQQSARKSDSVVLLNLKQLNLALKAKQLDTLSHIPYFKWENETVFHFYTGNYWAAYSMALNNIVYQIKLPENAKNMALNYAQKFIAYTVANNIYLASQQSAVVQITTDTNKNIVNGQTVSRSEFGIDGGLFWSPKGDKLAFYRKDESKVGNYPLVDINAREAEVNFIKYPMAGMPSEHISLGVYNLESGETVFIEKEDTVSEKYLTNITWSPDESNIYIQVLNRAQNLMQLKVYDAASGNYLKTLFQETNEAYVEPYHPLIFLENQPEQFIYQTRNEGYNHAYLYDTQGNLIRKITDGSWEITELVAVDKQNIYYMATKDSPIESHFYKTNIKNGKTNKLTQKPGTHNVIFNQSEGLFIDKYSNTQIPNVIDIMSVNGDFVRNALTAKNPLLNYKMPDMQIGSIKAADGETDLYYRIIKPIDFDPSKKYPAIVYVYGGPHAQLVNNRWLGGGRMWEYYMAQKGYVLFILDNRGSANRGLKFENVIHRQCGVNEMKDQLEGIKYLKNTGFVDMNRIGVHGWSYGGFMTTSLMVNYPETFKVGVAGGPVIDWKYYEVMYGERYMDTPEENPEGYMYTSLLPRAKDLKGKLLIIHGAVDPTVVWQNSQQFLKECIKNQVPVDYFVYPNAEHNVRGKDRIHLMQKVTNYFDDYLK